MWYSEVVSTHVITIFHQIHSKRDLVLSRIGESRIVVSRCQQRGASLSQTLKVGMSPSARGTSDVADPHYSAMFVNSAANVKPGGCKNLPDRREGYRENFSKEVAMGFVAENG